MKELVHHGVKGQKWGVRRYQNKDGTLIRNSKGRKSDKENIHDDYKEAHSKKKTSSMRDAELRKRLNRIQMEQQYSKLSKSSKSRGKRYVDKLIKSGTTVAMVTTTALTIYNNVDKIKKILNK